MKTNKTIWTVHTGRKLTAREIRKAYAREKLEEIWQAMTDPAGISWGELADLQEKAERIARSAGLLREARANGII